MFRQRDPDRFFASVKSYFGSKPSIDVLKFTALILRHYNEFRATDFSKDSNFIKFLERHEFYLLKQDMD